MRILSGKGKILLLIFLSLGLGQIPVVPLIIGPIIMYLGISIAVGKNIIWIPKSLLSKKIPSFFLTSIINQILKLLRFMKRWSTPRYELHTKHKVTRIINGIMIIVLGASFALCPPVPLSGLIAFLAIVSMAIGMMNDDGIYIIVGYINTILYLLITLLLIQFCSFSQIMAWAKTLW